MGCYVHYCHFTAQTMSFVNVLLLYFSIIRNNYNNYPSIVIEEASFSSSASCFEGDLFFHGLQMSTLLIVYIALVECSTAKANVCNLFEWRIYIV